MHTVQAWLTTLPPIVVFLIIGLVIMAESMGVPVPGEIALVSAALIAATGALNPWPVAVAASVGAIVGDSIGYLAGRRGGRAMLERLGRRFPRHFGPEHLASAEASFARWGVFAVFAGRFIALLRILAGPLAGVLRVPYPKFLAANASGGLAWAFGTTFAVYAAGQAAEKWLSGFAWLALVVAVLFGLATTLVLKRRSRALTTGRAGDVPQGSSHRS